MISYFESLMKFYFLIVMIFLMWSFLFAMIFFF